MIVSMIEISEEIAIHKRNAELILPVVEALVWSHDRFEHGGSKVHLSVLDKHSAFCGNPKDLSHLGNVDLNWVQQPDPDGELCLRCKKSAIKFLEKQNNQEWELKAKIAHKELKQLRDKLSPNQVDTAQKHTLLKK